MVSLLDVAHSSGSNDGTAAKNSSGAEGGSQQSNCSWEGENCVYSQCCKRTRKKCWEKEAGKWASCSMACEDLMQPEEEWSCRNLGGARGAHLVPKSTDPSRHLSLFCFMVVTPDGIVPPGVQEGYEQKLQEMMEPVKGSIFGCEGSAIYQGVRATRGEWKSIRNTEVFVKVWADVRSDRQYAQHDWTVKVDADAVFFPDRLKQHLINLKVPPKTPIYLHNVQFSFNFMGALEVMSKEAFEVLTDNLDACLEHIGSDGGEDIFTMQCLDAYEVGYMEDFMLLEDKYSHPGEFNLFDVDACSNDDVVAFHPYKAANSWMGCYKVALKQNRPQDFTDCEHRWKDEACSLTSGLDHPGQSKPGTGIVAA